MRNKDTTMEEWENLQNDARRIGTARITGGSPGIDNDVYPLPIELIEKAAAECPQRIAEMNALATLKYQTAKMMKDLLTLGWKLSDYGKNHRMNTDMVYAFIERLRPLKKEKDIHRVIQLFMEEMEKVEHVIPNLKNIKDRLLQNHLEKMIEINNDLKKISREKEIIFAELQFLKAIRHAVGVAKKQPNGFQNIRSMFLSHEKYNHPVYYKSMLVNRFNDPGSYNRLMKVANAITGSNGAYFEQQLKLLKENSRAPVEMTLSYVRRIYNKYFSQYEQGSNLTSFLGKVSSWQPITNVDSDRARIKSYIDELQEFRKKAAEMKDKQLLKSLSEINEFRQFTKQIEKIDFMKKWVRSIDETWGLGEKGKGEWKNFLNMNMTYMKGKSMHSHIFSKEFHDKALAERFVNYSKEFTDDVNKWRPVAKKELVLIEDPTITNNLLSITIIRFLTAYFESKVENQQGRSEKAVKLMDKLLDSRIKQLSKGISFEKEMFRSIDGFSRRYIEEWKALADVFLDRINKTHDEGVKIFDDLGSNNGNRIFGIREIIRQMMEAFLKMNSSLNNKAKTEMPNLAKLRENVFEKPPKITNDGFLTTLLDCTYDLAHQESNDAELLNRFFEYLASAEEAGTTKAAIRLNRLKRRMEMVLNEITDRGFGHIIQPRKNPETAVNDNNVTDTRLKNKQGFANLKTVSGAAFAANNTNTNVN
ncbi:hypothetical protein JXA85_02835 [Candidatus Woesearchaeota archaeon]|nr:hypothetical protein [Candidatus Woesearchaeota archaeon]